MTAADIKAKRAAAGIPGNAVCQVAGIARARLLDDERAYVTVSHEDLQPIDYAIEQILQTRKRLSALTTEAGLCLTGIRL